MSSVAGSFPRIIHQTWKSDSVPDEWRGYQESWRRHHPQWEYRLWTDAELRDLIASHHPEMLPRFDAYPLGVQRADVGRYVILKHYGGLYVDLDYECFKPLDDLFDGYWARGSRALLVRTRQTGGNPLSNAIMASAPQHVFWDRVLQRLTEIPWPRAYTRLPFVRHFYTIWGTGPQALQHVYAPDAEWAADIGFLPAEDFLPFKPLDEFSTADYRGYAIHHYSSSWSHWDTLMLTRLEAMWFRIARGA